jgi:hypothetical protein
MDGVLARLVEVDFALTLCDLCLQKFARPARGGCKFLLQRVQLCFASLDLLVDPILCLDDGLLLRHGSILSLTLALDRTMAACERIRFRSRKIKAETDDLVGEPAIISHQRHFAGIVRDLLIHGHLPVPVQRLIQKGNYARRIERAGRRILSEDQAARSRDKA